MYIFHRRFISRQPKEFAVVRFLESDLYSEVPSQWLADNNESCWWPNQSRKAASLMMKGIPYDPNTFVKHAVTVETFCGIILISDHALN